MEKLYIGLVDTPGLFAWMIRKAIRQDYIHVVLGMDEMLDECYSVGRRFPSIPLLAGFEREEKEKIIRAFPTARYMIFAIDCTKEQKENIRKQLKNAMKTVTNIITASRGCLLFYCRRNSSGRNAIPVPPLLPGCLRRMD